VKLTATLLLALIIITVSTMASAAMVIRPPQHIVVFVKLFWPFILSVVAVVCTALGIAKYRNERARAAHGLNKLTSSSSIFWASGAVFFAMSLWQIFTAVRGCMGELVSCKVSIW